MAAENAVDIHGAVVGQGQSGPGGAMLVSKRSLDGTLDGGGMTSPL